MTKESPSRYVTHKNDPKCKRCGNVLRRLKREGFLETSFFTFFGYFPWECPLCRSRVLVKKQYPRKKRSSVPETTSI
jgi:DNA-directed RNA polymerase subunit RPC12/RpoP